MTRVLDVGRALAIAMLGALLGAASLVFAYVLAPDLIVSMDIDPPPLVRGLYPIERTPDGLTFAWSHDVVRLNIPGLDRQHPWEFRLRFRGARRDPKDFPDVSVDVDGVTLAKVLGTNDLQDLPVTLPTTTGETRGAQIVIRASNTFVPGPGDTRKLGLQIDEMRLVRPKTGVPIVPRQAIASAALGAAIFGALFGLMGLTAGNAALAVGALAIGQAAAMVLGAGPYTRYAETVPLIALWISLSAIVIVWIVERVNRQRLRNTARFVAAFTSAVVFLKLLVLLHPNMPIGDALFQAHRFEWVRDGRWFFTSVAPGGYEFPYAIGLYLSALPLSSWVQGTAGFMLLLRVLVVVADAAAGLLLYPMVARATSDRLAGAIAVGLFHLIPLNFQVQRVGNLTNAFGQSLFAATMALVVLVALRPTIAGWIGLTVITAAAMLSHTSTFAIAAPVLLLVALLFQLRGTPDLQQRARLVFITTIVATLLSVGLYYVRFGETYAAQIARISGEMGKPAEQSDPGGRSITRRAATVPYYLNEYYGWPALILGAAGVVSLARRRETDTPHRALTLTVWAWIGGAATFLVLGVLTPIDFRHYLAAFPAIAILGARGAGRAWLKGPFLQAAAIVLLAAALVIGVRHWLMPL